MVEAALLLDEGARERERAQGAVGVPVGGEEARERVPHSAVARVEPVRLLEERERPRAISGRHHGEGLGETRFHPPRFPLDRGGVRKSGRFGLAEAPERVPAVEVGIREAGVGLGGAPVELDRPPIVAARRCEHAEVEPGERRARIEGRRGLEVRARFVAAAGSHQRGAEVGPHRRDLRTHGRGAFELGEGLRVPPLLEETRPAAEVDPPSDGELAHGREVRVERPDEEHPPPLHLGERALPVAERAIGESERIAERARLGRDAERLLEVPGRTRRVPFGEERPAEPAVRRRAGGVAGEGFLAGAARLVAAVEIERELAERDPGGEQVGIELDRAPQRSERGLRVHAAAQGVTAQVRPACIAGEAPLRRLVPRDRGGEERIGVVDHRRAAVGERELVGRERRGDGPLELGARRLEMSADLGLEVGEIGPGEGGSGGRVALRARFAPRPEREETQPDETPQDDPSVTTSAAPHRGASMGAPEPRTSTW